MSVEFLIPLYFLLIHSMTTGTLLDAKKILKDIGLRVGDKAADFGAGRTGHFVFPAAAATVPNIKAGSRRYRDVP